MKSVRRGAQLSELKETELGNFLAVQWLGLQGPRFKPWLGNRDLTSLVPKPNNKHEQHKTKQLTRTKQHNLVPHSGEYLLSISYFWYIITVMCCILMLLNKYLPTDQTEDQIMGSTQGAGSQHLIRIHLPI